MLIELKMVNLKIYTKNKTDFPERQDVDYEAPWFINGWKQTLAIDDAVGI